MRVDKGLWIALFLLVCDCQCTSLFDSVRDSFQDSLLRLAHRWAPQPTRYKRQADDKNVTETADRRAYAKVKFVQCGDETDPLHVEEFKMFPNPLVIPGTMQVGISLNVRENQSSPIPVELEMSKKVTLLFGLSTWFRIPCLSNSVGSCEFDDLCNVELFQKGLCQNSLDVPRCGCPLTKGNYTSRLLTFDIPQLPEVPDYLLHGEFYVKAIVRKDEQQMACYSTRVNLSDKSDNEVPDTSDDEI